MKKYTSAVRSKGFFIIIQLCKLRVILRSRCSKGKVPFGLSAERRLLVDRFDVYANRVHKRGFTRP